MTTKALVVRTGRARSKAERGTMLTVPARAAPWDSGVGEYSTSMRERLLTDIMSMATARPVLVSPTPELATLKPSRVIGTLAEGTPLMETSRELPPEFSMVMPGRNFRKSAELPSATRPNSSVERTFLILGAKRCSLMARAEADISFEVATTKASSFTVPSGCGAAGPADGAVSVRSSRAVPPALTDTVAVCTARPVKNAVTRAGPAGTPTKRKLPPESVKVSRAVPSTVRRARSTNSPLVALSTRPSIRPKPAAGEAAAGRAERGAAEAREMMKALLRGSRPPVSGVAARSRARASAGARAPWTAGVVTPWTISAA
jgi:hypothetical protein